MTPAPRPTAAATGAGAFVHTAAPVLGVIPAATLYEADGRLGGHAPTADVPSGDRTLRIDSGLIVHNERTRATLLRLLPPAERVRTAVPPRPLAPGGATA